MVALICIGHLAWSTHTHTQHTFNWRLKCVCVCVYFTTKLFFQQICAFSIFTQCFRFSFFAFFVLQSVIYFFRCMRNVLATVEWMNARRVTVAETFAMQYFVVVYHFSNFRSTRCVCVVHFSRLRSSHVGWVYFFRCSGPHLLVFI